MAPRIDTSKLDAHAGPHRLGFNADAAAIVIALTFAALVRLNVIHHIGW